MNTNEIAKYEDQSTTRQLGFVIAYAFLFTAIHYGYATEEEQTWYDAKKLTQVCFICSVDKLVPVL